MATLLSAVEARLDAVLAQGRGADGSLGADAQARAIAANQFRKAPEGAPLRDPEVPGESFDRGYSWEWRSIGDEPTTNNPLHVPQFRRCLVDLTVGYAFGANASGFVRTLGSETGTAGVRRARQRALEDGERIARALVFPDLTRGGTDPVIVGVLRESATVSEAIGPGRVVSVTTYVVLIQYDATTSYAP